MSFSDSNLTDAGEYKPLIYPAETFYSFKKNENNELKNEIRSALEIIERAGRNNPVIREFAEFREKIIPRISNKKYLLPSDYTDLNTYEKLLQKAFAFLEKRSNDLQVQKQIISLSSLQILEFIPLKNQTKIESCEHAIKHSIISIKQLAERTPVLNKLLALRSACLKQLSDRHAISLNGIKVVAEYTKFFKQVMSDLSLRENELTDEEGSSFTTLKYLELDPLQERAYEDFLDAHPMLYQKLNSGLSPHIEATLQKLRKIAHMSPEIADLLEFRQNLQRMLYDKEYLHPNDLLGIKQYESYIENALQSQAALLPNKNAGEIKRLLFLLKEKELIPLSVLASGQKSVLLTSIQVKHQAAEKGSLFQTASNAIKAYENTHETVSYKNESSNELFILPDKNLVIKQFSEGDRLEEEQLVANVAQFYLKKGPVVSRQYKTLQTPSSYLEPYDLTTFKRAYRPFDPPSDILAQQIAARLQTRADKDLWNSLVAENAFPLPSEELLLYRQFAEKCNVYTLCLPDEQKLHDSSKEIDYTLDQLHRLYKSGSLSKDMSVRSEILTPHGEAVSLLELLSQDGPFRKVLEYDPIEDLQRAPHFLPISNQEYQNCEQIHWEYVDGSGRWIPASFQTIHTLWLTGNVDPGHQIRKYGSSELLDEAEFEHIRKALNVQWKLVHKGVRQKNFKPYLGFSDFPENLKSSLELYNRLRWTYTEVSGTKYTDVSFNKFRESWLKGELNQESVIEMQGAGVQPFSIRIADYDARLYSVLKQKSVVVVENPDVLKDYVHFYSLYKHKLTQDPKELQALSYCQMHKWKVKYPNGNQWEGSFAQLKKLWLTNKIQDDTLIAELGDTNFRKIQQNKNGLLTALEMPLELIAPPYIIHVPQRPILDVLVKPFLENLHSLYELQTREGIESVETCLSHMDEESVMRALLTIPLQVMDLHASNIGLTPIQQDAFNRFKNMSFSIGTPEKTIENINIYQLQILNHQNSIPHHAIVSYEWKDSSGRLIKASFSYANLKGTGLDSLLKTAWNLELFDTDLSMGENNELNFHPHVLSTSENNVLLPFRSAFLGTRWSRKPLPLEIIDRLIAQKDTHKKVLEWMNRMDAPIRRKLTRSQNANITALLRPLLEQSCYTKDYCREFQLPENIETLQTKFANTICDPIAHDLYVQQLWKTLEIYLTLNGYPTFYTVQPGDTYASIAQKFGKDVLKDNPINSSIACTPGTLIRIRPDIGSEMTSAAQKFRENIAKQFFPRVTWKQRNAFIKRTSRQQEYLRNFQLLTDQNQHLNKKQMIQIITADPSPLSTNEVRQFLEKCKIAYAPGKGAKERMHAFRKELQIKFHPSYTALAKTSFPFLADMQELYELYFQNRERAGFALGCYKDRLSDILQSCVNKAYLNPEMAELAHRLHERISEALKDRTKRPGFLR
jgi:hypothetical protein